MKYASEVCVQKIIWVKPANFPQDNYLREPLITMLASNRGEWTLSNMLNRLPWKKNVRTPTFNFPCWPPAKHPLIQQNVTLKKYWSKACVPKDIGFIFWRSFLEIILLPKNLCTVHITFYLNVTNLPYLVKIPLNSFWERKLSRRCIILPGSNRKGTFLCTITIPVQK